MSHLLLLSLFLFFQIPLDDLLFYSCITILILFWINFNSLFIWKLLFLGARCYNLSRLSWVSLNAHPVWFDIDGLRMSCLHVLASTCFPSSFVLRLTDWHLFGSLSLMLLNFRLLIFRWLWRKTKLVVKLLPKDFELWEPFAEIVVLKMAASVWILIFSIGVFIKVNTLKIVKIKVVDIWVVFLHIIDVAITTTFILRIRNRGGLRMGHYKIVAVAPHESILQRDIPFPASEIVVFQILIFHRIF